MRANGIVGTADCRTAGGSGADKQRFVGWWNDELYKSLVDSNVYTPDQYAPNWSKQ